MRRIASLNLAILIVGCCNLMSAGVFAAESQQVIKHNEVAPSGGAEEIALRNFKKRIASDTQGRVKLDVHLNGALGNAQTSVQDMMFGNLELFTSNMVEYLPLMIDEVSGLDTPFLITSVDAAHRYLASPLLDEAREKVYVSRRIRYLEMNALRTPFHIIASKRAITKPEDLVGLKLTTVRPLTKTAIRLWQTLGVTYVATPAAEVKEAIKTGKIDAAIYPDLDTIDAAHLQQVAPHLVGLNDRPQIWQISIHEPTWKKLAEKDQAAILLAAQQSGELYEREAARRFKVKLARMTATGQIKFNQLDPTELRTKLLPMYKTLTEEGYMNPRVLDAANAAVAPH